MEGRARRFPASLADVVRGHRTRTRTAPHESTSTPRGHARRAGARPFHEASTCSTSDQPQAPALHHREQRWRQLLRLRQRPRSRAPDRRVPAATGPPTDTRGGRYACGLPEVPVGSPGLARFPAKRRDLLPSPVQRGTRIDARSLPAQQEQGASRARRHTHRRKQLRRRWCRRTHRPVVRRATVPLLVEGAQAFGSPITCDRVLAVLDWKTGLPLYRHASYRPPELRLAFREDEEQPWSVTHRDRTIARFADIGKAGAYIAFMRGASVDPHILHQTRTAESPSSGRVGSHQAATWPFFLWVRHQWPGEATKCDPERTGHTGAWSNRRRPGRFADGRHAGHGHPEVASSVAAPVLRRTGVRAHRREDVVPRHATWWADDGGQRSVWLPDTRSVHSACTADMGQPTARGGEQRLANRTCRHE